jgi:hypothetical protein
MPMNFRSNASAQTWSSRSKKEPPLRRADADDEDVQPAQARDGLAHDALRVAGLRQVAGHDGSLAAAVPNLRGDSLRALCRSADDSATRAPLPGEGPRRRRPDALARADHERAVSPSVRGPWVRS